MRMVFPLCWQTGRQTDFKRSNVLPCLRQNNVPIPNCRILSTLASTSLQRQNNSELETDLLTPSLSTRSNLGFPMKICEGDESNNKRLLPQTMPSASSLSCVPHLI